MNPAQLIENRDCLKLASRMVDDPVKVQAIRRLVKQEFVKNRDVIDQQQIRNLKLTAARGISNYIIHTVKQQYNIPNPNQNTLQQEQQYEQGQEEKQQGQHHSK